MTCIVHGVSRKKDLKQICKSINECQDGAPSPVGIEDPSIFNPRYFNLTDMRPGTRETVTNHPKRSWFALIERRKDGTFKVT